MKRENGGGAVEAAPAQLSAPQPFWKEASAGLALSAIMLAYALSFGALIFSGSLSPYAGVGVAAAMLSSAIACLVMAKISSVKYALAGPDTPVVAVVSALAIGIIGHLPVDAAPHAALSTVVVAIALTSLITALLLGAIGIRRIAGWVRFIPYPVVAGFLAASGWFLILGANRLADRSGASLSQIGAQLLEGSLATPLVAAVLCAAGIAILRAATRSSLILPAVVLASAAAMQISIEGLGVDVDVAAQQGWLAGRSDGQPVLPVLAVDLTMVDYRAIALSIPEIMTVAGVAAIATLLNATGLEVNAGAEVDLDREFRAGGAANIGLAAVGGLPANLSLNRSILAAQAGATRRAAAVVTGAACLALALLGGRIGAVIPTPVLAGVVFFMGGALIWRWLIASFKHLSTREYLLVIAIFLLIAKFGYVGGAALGVVAACLTFALTYSRVPFVRQRLTRREYGSYVERPAEDRKLLTEEGDRIVIFRLQGYLFFGTSNQLCDRVREAVEAAERPIRIAILDFKDVTGADSSAAFSLIKIRRFLNDHRVQLCLTGENEAMAEMIQDAPSTEAGATPIPPYKTFAALEQGLEWCEDELIRQFGGASTGRLSLEEWLTRELNDPPCAKRLAERIDRRLATAGSWLCRQGEASDSILFIVSGRVSIFLERPGAQPLRLRTMLGRTVIGEIGFYKGAARSASVYADEDSEVFALDRATFEQLHRDEPQVANALHAMIIRLLSDRLMFANREIAALQ